MTLKDSAIKRELRARREAQLLNELIAHKEENERLKAIIAQDARRYQEAQVTCQDAVERLREAEARIKSMRASLERICTAAQMGLGGTY